MSDSKIKNILLVTTESVDTSGAEQTAMEMAGRHGAHVTIVDSIRTPFHVSRYGSVSTEMMFEIAMKVKQDYLDKVAERFRTAGIEAESHVLMTSRTSEELVKRALACNADIVIRYLKGEHSRAEGRFGHTAQNLIRVCPCRLLLVDHPLKTPKILACLNPAHGPTENQSIITAAVSIAESDEQLNGLSCWKLESLLAADNAIAEAAVDFEKVAKEILTEFKSKYDVSKFDSRFFVEQGDSIAVIPNFCADHLIDVAVMSSASLNHPLGRLLGTTIESTINKLPCALLVVKPHGFISPVAMEQRSLPFQARSASK